MTKEEVRNIVLPMGFTSFRDMPDKYIHKDKKTLVLAYDNDMVDIKKKLDGCRAYWRFFYQQYHSEELLKEQIQKTIAWNKDCQNSKK